MTKKSVGPSTAHLGQMSLENVRAHNAKMREGAPRHMHHIIDEVDAAIDAENADLNLRLEQENKLRIWAKDLLGVSVTISQVEDLNHVIAHNEAGKPFKFVIKLPADDQVPEFIDVWLIKTPFGTVDRIDRYLHVLEKALIDLSSQPKQFSMGGEVIKKEQFTDESFFGLIKLAFQRLFKRK